MSEIIFYLGGAKSGKTRAALERASAWPAPRLYLATAQALDQEMARRVKNHQAERGPDWRTLEEPLNPAQALKTLAPGQAGVVLLDCLTLWLSNLLGAERDFDLERARFKALDLAEAALNSPAPVIMVSNEVGGGIVPENALARFFRDAAGVIHQTLAREASEVYLVVAGLPLPLKK